MKFARYNKFIMSLTGPLAAALVAFAGFDMDAATGVATTAGAFLGSLSVLFGPANR